MIYIIVALIAGAITIVSNTINASLGKAVGTFVGVFFNYISGLLLVVLLLITTTPTLVVSGHIPFYAYLGGVVGVSVVALSNFVIPKIPIAYVTILIFVGQIFTGFIIDFFVYESLSPFKILGGVVVAIGVYYSTRQKKENVENTETL